MPFGDSDPAIWGKRGGGVDARRWVRAPPTAFCIYLRTYIKSCMFGAMTATVQQRLAAISEPNRFRIVELLKDGPQPVGSIVDAIGLAQPLVSRHLRLLAEAGVVEVTKRAQQRIYRLHPDAMHVLSDWVQGFAALWVERMDRLGSLLGDDRAPEPNL